MTRPQTVEDVFEVLSRHRLVEPARLSAFIDRHRPNSVAAALERLVADGILTEFQATEVEVGRGGCLWLGGYRILDRLGKGGMGNVFLAEHPVLGRRIAVKALSDALRADPGARRRFVREARAAAALDHPNIVHVFDVNMTHDPPYLVMEYVDGVSLQAAVSQSGTFSVGEAACVGLQVADGLTQAASVGLVHRDIKPANLLVDRRGAVKILDLGIVRFTHDDTFSRVNGAEVILGTVDYLAPEQAENSSRVDTRADIYALGATLYFLLAGHPPYTAVDVRRKLAAKRNADPPPIHQLRPDVPAEFSELLCKLMARDPAARVAAPAAVVAALHPWAAPGPDFPGRLFRATSDSTAHGRRLTDHEPARELLPETIRIVKPGRRGNSGSPRPAPDRPEEPGADEAPLGGPEVVEGPQDGAAPVAAEPKTDEIATLALDTLGVGSEASLTDEMRVPLDPPAPAAASPDAILPLADVASPVDSVAALGAPVPEPATEGAGSAEPSAPRDAPGGWLDPGLIVALAVLAAVAALVLVLVK